MEVFHFPLSDNVTDQSDLYWAWALTPLPAPASPADSAFLRIRLMAPEAALTRAAAEFSRLGGIASTPAQAAPPLQARVAAILTGTAAPFERFLAGRTADRSPGPPVRPAGGSGYVQACRGQRCH